MRVQMSITVSSETADYIRNAALSNRAYGAYVDQLVQKERLKSVTLERLDEKLNKVLENTTRS